MKINISITKKIWYLLAFFILIFPCVIVSMYNLNKDTLSDIETIQTIDVSPLNRPASIDIPTDTKVHSSFLTGVDVSSVISLEESGVIFYNEDNSEQDIFRTLKENGVNCIRVRIWNNPYDKNGNSYGGGHNDLETAKAIGIRATTYGMPLYVDFHYSDFWADPQKQTVPKAWSTLTFDQKLTALYDYTYSSLETLIKSGINIHIVQIGNETTTGFCGETDWNNICKLLNAGSKAVRDISNQYNLDINVALHFTNPEKVGHYEYLANILNEHTVDYDIFASSYYPYWHGSLENLYNCLENISLKYNKYTLVAETAYPYTYIDTDGFDNSINSYNYSNPLYDVSVSGQVHYLNDLIDTLAKLEDKCLGVFYWEAAWITVGTSYTENKNIWEKYGSGWASSFSFSYDPDDAGKYFGGSSFDNQALFDKYGKPLPSLSLFRYIK